MRPERSSSGSGPSLPYQQRVLTRLAAFMVALAALSPFSGSIGLAQSPSPAVSTTDWPLTRGNADRDAHGSGGPVGNPVVRWQFHADAAVNAQIAIVDDLVYVTDADGVLHALGLDDGVQRWHVSIPDDHLSGPSVAEGVVYAFDDLGTLLGYDARTGAERVRGTTAVLDPSAPTIGGGLVFVGAVDGTLVAIDAASGETRWTVTVSTKGGTHSPAYADGRVYVGADGGGFNAYDAVTGADIWHFDTGADQTGTAVVADGVAFVGGTDSSDHGHLWALDAATGAVRWVVDEPWSSPAVADGVAVSGSGTLGVAAHELATGAELWRASTNGVVRPVAIADGIAYVPVDQAHVVDALDLATGTERWHFDVDGGNDCCAAVSHGAVFIGTSAGTVYAIGGDGSTGAAGSPTPSASPSPSGHPATPSIAPSFAAAPVTLAWSSTGPADGMDFPGDLAIDPKGRIWVADTGNNRFAIFRPDGTFIETWAGSGKKGLEFDLERANGDGYGAIAFAPDGSFYVLDVGNHRVQHFDAKRKLVGTWGKFGLNPGQFNDPVGIAVDAAGTVYVLDDVRNVVERYDADGTVLGSSPAGARGLNTANNLTLGPEGDYYVSLCCDVGNRVALFGPDGVAKNAKIGQGLVSDQPSGMDLDSAGRLFVTWGSEVLVFAPDESLLTRWGAPGSGATAMQFAFGVSLDGKGAVYVNDAGANELKRFDLLPPLAP